MSTEPKKPFEQWYAVNKDTHNERRRTRYKTDPAYQEQVRERARLAAAAKRAESKGVITREYRGQQVQVFRISTLADLCGVTANTLKRKEQTGEIPRCTFEGTHRVYTAEQRDLVIGYLAGKVSKETMFEQWGD